MINDITFLRPLVATVLRQPYAAREWTVQGFGFMRTYFGPPENPKQFRLNLWNSRFTIPNVSTVHDHPWDFKSVIVAGLFCNLRYDDISHKTTNLTHHVTTIMCGIDGGLTKSPIMSCALMPTRPELYRAGDTYSQRANEVHETIFIDGTITLNERTGDTEHARVFWPYGTEWVDAKPRLASRDEVTGAVSHALREWY